MFRQLFLGAAWLLHSLRNVKCREVALLQQEWKQEVQRMYECSPALGKASRKTQVRGDDPVYTVCVKAGVFKLDSKGQQVVLKLIESKII